MKTLLTIYILCLSTNIVWADTSICEPYNKRDIYLSQIDHDALEICEKAVGFARDLVSDVPEESQFWKLFLSDLYKDHPARQYFEGINLQKYYIAELPSSHQCTTTIDPVTGDTEQYCQPLAQHIERPYSKRGPVYYKTVFREVLKHTIETYKKPEILQ